MKTTDLTPDGVRAAADVIGEDSPFFMVNLLCYREQADYGDRPGVAPVSGREAYFAGYLPAFNEVASAEGVADKVRVFWVGSVLARLVAPPDEEWDDIAIVEYANVAAFRRVVESPRYRAEAAPHRRAALEDWRLIATAATSLPG